MNIQKSGLSEIDWGAIFGKVADAVPGVVKSVYDYKTAKATGYPTTLPGTFPSPTGDYAYNPNYSGTYSPFPTLPGQASDMTPFIIGGIALVGVLLLMRKN